jgi:hypothetical protein
MRTAISSLSSEGTGAKQRQAIWLVRTGAIFEAPFFSVTVAGQRRILTGLLLIKPVKTTLALRTHKSVASNPDAVASLEMSCLFHCHGRYKIVLICCWK